MFDNIYFMLVYQPSEDINHPLAGVDGWKINRLIHCSKTVQDYLKINLS
jgi:hypothetical protein